MCWEVVMVTKALMSRDATRCPALDERRGIVMFAGVNWGSFGFYREGRAWSFFDDPATCD
jgi:hypothetical protein